MNYWLIKSEPSVFSIDDLARVGVTCWDGIRNYQARNYLRDGMRVGDRVLFYHSNADPPAVVGIAEVVREAYPDSTALDPEHPHFDPRSTPENPIWLMTDIGFVAKFSSAVPLERLKDEAELSGMAVIRRGMRLSVQPVTEAHFRRVCEMGGLTFP
ncbi:MAG: EVE domain-containing protein [Capsulimonadales bacterium]|nr:EVE domain-containing protein [Capsulimonadales bacterium]